MKTLADVYLEHHNAARALRCAYCGVGPGQACRTKFGNVSPMDHSKRRLQGWWIANRRRDKEELERE